MRLRIAREKRAARGESERKGQAGGKRARGSSSNSKRPGKQFKSNSGSPASTPLRHLLCPIDLTSALDLLTTSSGASSHHVLFQAPSFTHRELRQMMQPEASEETVALRARCYDPLAGSQLPSSIHSPQPSRTSLLPRREALLAAHEDGVWQAPHPLFASDELARPRSDVLAQRNDAQMQVHEAWELYASNGAHLEAIGSPITEYGANGATDGAHNHVLMFPIVDDTNDAANGAHNEATDIVGGGVHGPANPAHAVGINGAHAGLPYFKDDLFKKGNSTPCWEEPELTPKSEVPSTYGIQDKGLHASACTAQSRCLRWLPAALRPTPTSCFSPAPLSTSSSCKCES